MRVYFEKPRTTTGWKGMINDPHLDGSGDVNSGLRMARGLLLEVLGLGLPVGCEFLDPIIPQYISDAVAWGAIGARTTESQTHRQLGSGLSMPVGFKNRTDGNVQVAVDAVRAAAVPHAFTGVDESGRPAILYTKGNPDCHVILRGGRDAPNYPPAAVGDALAQLRAARLPERLVIDASHDNSGKDHNRQPIAAADLAEQVAGGSRAIVGVMLESFLVAGRQEIGTDGELAYGQSITDACMDWDTTAEVLERAGRRRVRATPRGMRIAVLGVGLIGGSVGLAARRSVAGAEVVGFGRDPGRLGARARARRHRRRGRLARGGARRRRGVLRLRARGRAARAGVGRAGGGARGLRGHRRGLHQAAAARRDRRPALRGRAPDRRRGDERRGERPRRPVPGSRLVPHARRSARPGCSTSASTGC